MRTQLFIALIILSSLHLHSQKIMHLDFGAIDSKNVNVSSTSNSEFYDLQTYGKIWENSKSEKHHFFCSEKAFFLDINLPEGIYRLDLVLGGNSEGSNTSLKAESRRLMFENVNTKANKTKKISVVVEVRRPQFGDNDYVRLREADKSYKNWDDKLNLEFTGKLPCVSSLEITKVDDLPVLFLAGNSTVTDQENDPWASWGQMFPNFLNTKCVVANHARSGETLLAFKGEKRFAKILSQMKKGDYLFIEFAHNDQKAGKNHLDPFTTYTQELKYYINEAKKKGGSTVLVTSTMRRRFTEEGKIENTLGDYPAAMRKLAKEENILLIDLNEMSKNVFESLGVEGSKKALVHYPANTYPNQPNELADNTHFSAYGAYELAKCVVSEMIVKDKSLKKFVKKDFPKYNSKQPLNYSDFVWYESPMIDTTKPDGN